MIVDVRNELDEPMTVHWHGMELPARMDGGPHQLIPTGDEWSPEWTIEQPAATLWYHPHPHGSTEQHVRQGLAGMFIVRDEAEPALGLPREYGVDDVPVMIQDVRFDAEGRFATDVRGSICLIGDELLVNGTLGAYLDVTTEFVRMRLLNASTARVCDFGFDDQREFSLIATDGGLLTAPVGMTGIRLSPGERAEIVVSMRSGESTVLRSTPPDLGTSDVMAGMNAGNDRLDVLELRAATELAPSPPLPGSLVAIEPIPDIDAVERRFALDGTNINGRQMDASRIDEVVETGRTEAWTVVNEVEVPHNFHVHTARFQIDSIDGERPPPELAGWKDTVYLRPDVEYRLLMRFEYADPEQPYMYHCHLLWHEDRGMMGQFVVVRPGQQPGEPPPIHNGAPSGSVDSFETGSSHDHH